MKSNRSALWALIGVVVGFGLPALAFVGLIIVVVASTAQLAGQATPSLNKTTHVSGPLSGPGVALIDVGQHRKANNTMQITTHVQIIQFHLFGDHICVDYNM